jgi:hypothetical protein
MLRVLRTIGFAALLAAFGAGAASAVPDASGSTTLTEPNGLYTAVKSYALYSATNPDNPLPLAGNYTYTYTITNQAGSLTCLVGFDLEVPSGSVTAAGFIPGAGIAPSATTVGATVVEWDWFSPNICAGETSEQLYVHSTYGPGTVVDNLVSVEDEFSFTAQGTCVGPFIPPQDPDGEPIACTIGFWKNRADGKQGTLEWFPDGDFTATVNAAVALSSGIFSDAADLLFYLQSKGPRTILVRAKQQLAATLLNLAAGDLFPDNQKCKLFEGNHITSNTCGTTITVGTAVNYGKVDILGNEDEQHEAQACFDDLNNGIGVVQ